MLLDSIRYVLLALLLILIQFFLVQQVNFGSWILPMPYIYLLFIIPFSLNRFGVLFLAFGMGYLLDGISDSYGMNAAATVTLAFAKYYADKWFIDTDSIQLQGYNNLTPAYKGFGYYAVYTLILIFLHHLVFFSLNYFKFSAFFTIIGVALGSSVATFLFILLYSTIAGRR